LNKYSSLLRLFSSLVFIFLKQGILLFFILREKINNLPFGAKLSLARFKKTFSCLGEKK